MKTPEFINKINWSDLRTQKGLLLETINNDAIDPEHKDALQGILHLIDALQDYAVDEMGIDEMHIFYFEVEEERDKETPEEKFARTMADIIFQMHIESSSLYEDEDVPKEFIESIVDDDYHSTTIKNNIRLTILDDINNNVISELKYTPEMYDYGYEIIDYCRHMYNIYNNNTKFYVLCNNCGSDNVEIKQWVNPNTGLIGNITSDNDDEDVWCNDCETHSGVCGNTLKDDAKIIGYQVVGKKDTKFNGEIHPHMDASFCIYSLSQARVMLMDDDDNWRLLAIWEGDIEDPTFMFSGNPRT